MSTSGAATASPIGEFFYGFSPLRWLNDGLDIGANAAEKWSSNADTSEWTIAFREGLRWSDGILFDVDDILFWYEDMAVPGHDAQTIPPGCISASGKPCTMTRLDRSTLKLTYDAPQPLVPDNLAEFAKGNIGQNGPVWVLPKHYLRQFHPKYNSKVPKNWDVPGGLWEQKADWKQNPGCPTLIGYKCKSFNNNQGVVLDRNPYYYVVTKEGDQLPYIDEWQFNIVQNSQVALLQIQQGKVDYVHGPYNNIGLANVATLSANQKNGNYQILRWDSGSGTGSIFFLNYDYVAKDKKYGTLFRDKRFRQAISYGFDRETAWKTLYFQSGTTTTGTEGPKILEFHAKPDGPAVYTAWRDSYKDLDRTKAKSLLAELGLRDVNGDGYVEFPDGSELTVEIPYSANIDTLDGAKDDQLVSDMKHIGLRMIRRPVSPTAFGVQWSAGLLMSHTNWEVSNDGSELVYPQWVVPLESARWAPLEGMWNALTGQSKQTQQLNLPPLKRNPPRMKPDTSGPIAELINLYNQSKREPDQMKRNQLVWQMFKIHIDEGPFFMGCVANYLQFEVHNTDLKNVPSREALALHGNTNPWGIPTPGGYDPEVYYWAHPGQHGA